MIRLQNGELLSMVGKGTVGGQLRADGSAIERGVHLRWQTAPELGFPPGGFSIYRRVENYRQFLHCGAFREIDLGGVAWDPYGDDYVGSAFIVAASGEVRSVRGCGKQTRDAAAFPGAQEVRLEFREPARVVRIIFDQRTTPNPIAEAFWQSNSGDVLLERRSARLQGTTRSVTLFADQIDYVRLTGENMVICEVCFVLVLDGFNLGWPQLPLNGGTAIYLPITHPEWNSPHSHAPDDQAEAESRLPVGLLPQKHTAYSEGFQDELHGILYSLVGTTPQWLYRMLETDAKDGATLDWPGLNLLHLMAIDPNIARILGLYWHDIPPSDTDYFDYRVVAHYGDTLFPGVQSSFSDLVVGTRYGSILKHRGIAYSSPNPIDAVRASWQGSEHNALLFTHSILFGPIAIRLPSRMPSVTLHIVAAGAVLAVGYWEQKAIATAAVVAGEQTIELTEPTGMDTVQLFTAAELTLISIVVRIIAEPIRDLVYDTYHHSSGTSSTVPVPELEVPQVLASITGLDEQGALQVHQSSVGLRWNRHEAGGAYLRADAPVLVQVRRADLDEDGETVLHTAILNEAAPALVSQRREASGAQSEPPHYADRSVRDGRYAYAARGIDIFGVLSNWSTAQTIDVQDRRAPPPPQAVRASYLDPLDPWLSQEDRDWTSANGPGLKLSWEWPGMFRLQAPDVAPPDAEFRVYSAKGGLNSLSGNVTQVTVDGAHSDLVTDLRWPGAPNALAREWVRVGQHFFQIVANSSGVNCVITVDNLAAPERVPEPAPCSITFSPGRRYWADYGEAASWQQRLHVEAAAAIPFVSAHVSSLADFDRDEYAGDTATTISRVGATRTITTDSALDDAGGVLLPGVLLCKGVVYPAYGHTVGDMLKVHFVPVVSPTDAEQLIEPPIGARCVYYPGRKYEARIAGLDLPVPPRQATAQAQMAMSCSDGKPYADDNPVWSQPGRGGLGERPGNESVLSPVCSVVAVKRTQPAAIANVPVASDAPIFARPANYYGQARYTLAWDAVAGADGYAVYRCSGAALFDQDRAQRQAQAGHYASGDVFGDDAGYAAWLVSFDPALSETEMLAHPDDHFDAWRSWAKRFYPQLSGTQVQNLADREGNQAAFRRLNTDALSTTSYDDTFDGRGRGFYLYRIRTLDAAGNLSDWSATFPPVHIFDVTPPATPRIASVLGGERSVTISWRANREADLREYRIWRAQNRDELEDVRRVTPNAILAPTVGAVLESYQESGLAGGTNLFFRLAAVDQNGNISAPSGIVAARTVDTRPPDPPIWISASWNITGLAIELQWQLTDPTHEVLVQRSMDSTTLWVPVSVWLEAGVQTFIDTQVRSSKAYNYRLLVRNDSSMLNEQFSIQTVPTFR